MSDLYSTILCTLTVSSYHIYIWLRWGLRACFLLLLQLWWQTLAPCTVNGFSFLNPKALPGYCIAIINVIICRAVLFANSLLASLKCPSCFLFLCHIYQALPRVCLKLLIMIKISFHFWKMFLYSTLSYCKLSKGKSDIFFSELWGEKK